MAVIRWNPWSLSSFISDDLDFPTIPGISKLVGQGLNIYETDEAIVVEAALPGVPENKIDVSQENGIYRITGSMAEKEEEKEKKRYYMSSLSSSYNYSFRLPQETVESEPEAQLNEGILRLTFKKAKKAPPKKIQIRKTEKGK
jgi:HSP20 family protein